MRFKVQGKAKSETPACGPYNEGIRLCSAVGHCVVPNATSAPPNHRLCPVLCCSYHIIPPVRCFLRHRLPFPGGIQLFIPLGSLCSSIPIIFLKYANFSFPLFQLYLLLPPFLCHHCVFYLLQHFSLVVYYSSFEG